MKVLKKALPLMLAVCLLLTMLPIVHADNSLTYTIQEDGVWITGGSVTGALDIPAEIEGKPVVGIAERAFYRQGPKITSVHLPETLRYIEEYALFECTNLLEPIAIPDCVEWIAFSAFDATPISGKAFSAAERYWLMTGTRYFRKIGTLEGYEAIEEDGALYWVHEGEAELVQILPDVGGTLELPETVGGYPLTALGPYCTRKNREFNRLYHVIVPGTIHTIPKYAFYDSNIRTIYLCEGVQTVGAYSLAASYSDLTVTLPRSIEQIDNACFDYSPNNTTVYAYSGSAAAKAAASQHCTVISRDGADGMTYGVWGGISFRAADGKAEILRGSTLYAPEYIEDWRVTKLDLNSVSGGLILIPSGVTEIEYDSRSNLSNVLFLIYPGSYGERFCKANRLSYESVYTYLGVPFEDTPEDRWYYDAVCHCYHTGLMSGVAETRFAPNSTASRAMLVTVLWRMAGCPDAAAPSGFLDVAEDAWYADAVAWAQENGIVNGVGEGRFDPDGAITREQLATILCRCLDGEADARGLSETAEFPDAECISPWALDAFAWAKTAGILKGQLSGSQVYLNPLGNTSRAELATVLARLN